MRLFIEKMKIYFFLRKIHEVSHVPQNRLIRAINTSGVELVTTLLQHFITVPAVAGTLTNSALVPLTVIHGGAQETLEPPTAELIGTFQGCGAEQNQLAV